MLKHPILTVILSALSLLMSSYSQAEEEQELTEMSLEELMNIEVSTVSRGGESLMHAAAAAYVINQEEIATSGATSVPELLRMVPGLYVARADSNKWAITSRGFNSRFARYMLVMVDGRTVYNPSFSGVYWESQNIPLSTIERIEIVRGPGGAMWGANAMNGVINIITKSTKDTQHTTLTLGHGTHERGFAQLVHGEKINDDAFYRLSLSGFNRDRFESESRSSTDDWRTGQSNLQVDWNLSDVDKLTIQGAYYKGKAGQTTLLLNRLQPEDVNFSGHHLLFKWERELEDDSNMALQFYYDKTKRSEVVFDTWHNTYDLDFQYNFSIGDSHQIVWGAGYRHIDERAHGSATLSVADTTNESDLFSAFIQDRITLSEDLVALTIGTKIEHNDYTQVELQPNVRLTITPNEQQTIWAAISRAVRTPARMEQEYSRRLAPLVGAFPTYIAGNDEYGEEKLVAYELGYRHQLSEELSIDISTFYHKYKGLQTGELYNPSAPLFQFRIEADNKADGEEYGFELAVKWQALEWWHLSAAYSFARLNVHPDHDSNDVTAESFETDVPRNQFSALSTMNLRDDLDLSLWFRYVDNVDDIRGVDVDKYLTLDATIAWRINENLTLSITGQNLLDKSHPETGPSRLLHTETSEVPRSVYAKLIYEF